MGSGPVVPRIQKRKRGGATASRQLGEAGSPTSVKNLGAPEKPVLTKIAGTKTKAIGHLQLDWSLSIEASSPDGYLLAVLVAIPAGLHDRHVAAVRPRARSLISAQRPISPLPG